MGSSEIGVLHALTDTLPFFMQRDRPGEHRGERMADGRGRWGDKPPVADSWRGKDDRWGPPGGDRGAHRGERDRDGPMGGGRDAMGRAPRRWEEGHDWDRRPERRSDHHELGGAASWAYLATSIHASLVHTVWHTVCR